MTRPCTRRRGRRRASSDLGPEDPAKDAKPGVPRQSQSFLGNFVSTDVTVPGAPYGTNTGMPRGPCPDLEAGDKAREAATSKNPAACIQRPVRHNTLDQPVVPPSVAGRNAHSANKRPIVNALTRAA